MKKGTTEYTKHTEGKQNNRRKLPKDAGYARFNSFPSVSSVYSVVPLLLAGHSLCPSAPFSGQICCHD